MKTIDLNNLKRREKIPALTAAIDAMTKEQRATFAAMIGRDEAYVRQLKGGFTHPDGVVAIEIEQAITALRDEGAKIPAVSRGQLYAGCAMCEYLPTCK